MSEKDEVLKQARQKTKRKEVKKETELRIPTGNELTDIITGGGFTPGIVNIIGDSSAGKCLKNGYLLTNEGFQKIDDIGNSLPYGETEYKNTISLEKGKEVKTSHFWKEKVNKTIAIRTRHGFTEEATYDHPIMVYTENNAFIMKKFSELKKDDVMVISTGTERYNKNYYEIPKKYIPTINVNAKKVKLPKKVDEDFAYILGCLVADGNISTNSIAFSNTRKWMNDNMDRCVNTVFKLKRGATGHIHSITVKDFVFNLLGKPEKYTGRNKYVPECIMQSPKSVQASFLRALIDCDGSFEIKKSYLEYSTASERLAKEVQLLLLNMNIVVSDKIKKKAKVGDKVYIHNYHRLSISKKDLQTYIDVIGSDKYEFSNVIFKGKRQHTDFNCIPYLTKKMKADIKSIRKKVGWSKNGCMQISVNGVKTFPQFKNISSTRNGTYFLIDKFIELFKPFEDYFDISFYEKLEERNYHFDPITEIEYKEEETDVFDFHVPDIHLFWANGFINHNTFLAVESIYATKKKFGNKVKVRYNDAESGFSFNTQEMYGFSLKDSMAQTATIQDFVADFGTWADKIKDDEIGFYVVDSFDGLCSDEDLQEFEERKKEYKKGNDYKKGSYDMSKQKFASKLFRTIARTIKNKNIVLFIISQIRDNVGVMYGTKWKVSGGNGLKFYSDTRLFLRSCEKFKEQDRQIGYCLEVTGIKTRTKWPNRQCYLNIYHDFGMDNISSNIDYLYDLKDSGKLAASKCNAIQYGDDAKEVTDDGLKEFLEKEGYDLKEEFPSMRRFSKKKVMEFIVEKPELKTKFVELFGVTDRETLISYIEDNDLENELSEKAKKKWYDIEEAIRPKRKKKSL